MDRTEHVAWCKERALEYLNRGDFQNALTSMLSDLDTHDETRPSPMLSQLGMMYLMNGDNVGVKRFIEGFN